MVAAMELFEKMVKQQKELCDEATYGTIINGFCKAGETQKAMGLLKRIVNFEGIKLNLYSFNAIIYGLIKERRTEAALSLFPDLTSRGLKPDVVSYNSLINGL